MSDTQNAAPETTTDVEEKDEGASEDPKETLEFWKSEALEARKRRDSASKRARELDARLKELESKFSDGNKKTAEDSGDVARLKAEYQRDLEAISKERDSLQGALKKQVIENRFRSLGAELFHKDGLEDAWLLTKDQFELEQDDEGNYVPLVKGSSYSFETYLRKLAESKPHLAAPTKKPGTGSTGPATGNGSTGMTLAELVKLPDAEQKKVLASNPELMKQVFATMK